MTSLIRVPANRNISDSVNIDGKIIYMTESIESKIKQKETIHE